MSCGSSLAISSYMTQFIALTIFFLLSITGLIRCLDSSYSWSPRFLFQSRLAYLIAYFNISPLRLGCHWIEDTCIGFLKPLNRVLFMDMVLHMHHTTLLCNGSQRIGTRLSSQLPSPTATCFLHQVDPMLYF
jgi:hypothetical protein